MAGAFKPAMNARLIGLLAAGSLLAAAPSARADDVVSSSFAQLTGADGCMVQTGYVATTAGCATGHGLLNAAAVTVSPDQKNVYVASSMSPEGGGSNAVLTFTRDTATGALKQAGCISDDGGDGRPGSDGLCTDGDVLAGANAIAISPDGLHVYVAAAAQSGIAVFDRDPETGALTESGCVKSYSEGDRCATATGLRGVDGITVSPDGKNVYAAARESNAVVAFTRDAETGQLSSVGCVSNTGHDGACTDATALDGAGDIVVAPDGRTVYVTAHKINAITVLARDAETGVLTPAGCFMDAPPEGGPCKKLDGISGAAAMALSPDGKSLYMVSALSGTLVTFSRDLETGALTPTGCLVNAQPSGADSVYQEPDDQEDDDADEEDPDDEDIDEEDEDYDRRDAATCSPARALLYASEVAVSPDGRSVFAAGDGRLTAFERNRDTGALRQVGCAEAYQTYRSCSVSAGLSGIRGLASSDDGRSLYTTGASQLTSFGATVAVTTRRARVSRAGIARVKLACPKARRRGCAGRLVYAGAARAHFRIARGKHRTIRLHVPRGRRHLVIRARDAHHVTRPAVRRVKFRR